MNLQALIELRNRLEASAVAGVGLAEEDFRLRRAVEQIQPLAQAAPVFAKIHAQATKLTAQGEEDRAGRLLSTLALVDAVLCTQGRTEAEGALLPIEVTGAASGKPLPYSALAPLLTALTGTGGGRFSVVADAINENSALLQDYRLRNALVGALGDSYSELADLAAIYLSAQGPDIAPLLKRGFDPLGKKDMARRVNVMGRIAGAAENDWYLDMLEQKCDPAVRCALLENLRFSQENEACLLDFAQSERGNAKKAALGALAYIDTPAVAEFFKKKLEKDAKSVREYLEPVRSAWIADIAAAHLTALLEETLLADELSEEKYDAWGLWLGIAGGKDSQAMRDFYAAASAHHRDLAALQCGNDKKGKIRGLESTLDELVGTCMARTAVQAASPALLELALALWRREPSPVTSAAALIAALLTLPAAQAYETFFPDDGASVRRLPRAQWESCGWKQFWRFVELLTQKDGRYALLNWFTYNRSTAWAASHPLREALDTRWFSVMTDWEIARSHSAAGYHNYDTLANTIVDVKNDQARRILIDAFRAHARSKPSHYYFGMLEHLGDRNFRGLLAPCWATERYLNIHSMLETLSSSSLTPEEQAAELREAAACLRKRTVKPSSLCETIEKAEEAARQIENGVPLDKINV